MKRRIITTVALALAMVLGFSVAVSAADQTAKLKRNLSSLNIGDSVYTGRELTDMCADGHVSVKVPESWMDDYVVSRLTNNGISGYQFALNALEPVNTEYAEMFYCFYFDYETYLDKPPARPTDGDNEDIEKVIMKNILTGLEDTFRFKVNDLAAANGVEYDYCSVTYRPADNNDYRLEFVFRPDSTGIVCMLYLYFPKAGAVNHTDEVTYAVESVR